MKGYAPVMNQPGPKPRVLLADKGYDADFILADLEARGVAAVIPAKRNRKVQPVIDGCIYALRNQVERCFSKLKHSRRLATRYDKTADSFLGFVLVANQAVDQAFCPHRLSRDTHKKSSITSDCASTAKKFSSQAKWVSVSILKHCECITSLYSL